MDYPLWINNFDRVRDHKLKYPLASKIFEHPVSFWYGERNGKEMRDLDHSIVRLLKRTHPALPILVVYNMPNRDMGHHSKGGAHSKDSYFYFLESFADGIKDQSPIVIFEPDSLPHTVEMDDDEANWRLSMMKEGIELFTNRCNALVYVDIGHSNWLNAEDSAKLLNTVCNDKVRGFSVNVSNYRTTKESMDWALKICELRPNDHFVIDTSRNGNGPHGNEWCNPPGRSLGTPPTTNTGEEKCDAFLWIKIPGESDGKANGGPKAGKFWGEQAEELVTNYENNNK